MGLFNYLFGISNENADLNSDVLCNDFYYPIVDNGELYEKWKNTKELEDKATDELLKSKICPYLSAPCCKEKCVSYHGSRMGLIYRDVPLSEKIDAWIEKRPVKKSYVGYYYESKCKKGVF